jgi:FMN reductase
MDCFPPCVQVEPSPQLHWHACCYEQDRLEISHDIRAQRSLHDLCLHIGDLIQGILSMLVVSLSGSPALRSRSGVVLKHAARWLQERGVEVTALRIQDFNAEDLLFARFDSPQVVSFIEAVKQADGLLIGTPVYKASFSGALKTLLDLLPERSLHGKVVLPLATGGSIAHMLAVDYALKPVLSALKCQEVLHGIYAIDSQISYNEEHESGGELDEILTERLHEGLEHFQLSLQHRAGARHKAAGGHLKLAL